MRTAVQITATYYVLRITSCWNFGWRGGLGRGGAADRAGEGKGEGGAQAFIFLRAPSDGQKNLRS